MTMRLHSMIAVLLLCSATIVCADSGTRSVNTEVCLPTAPQEVLDAFLDAEDLMAWWNVSRSLVEARPGGIWSIAWYDWGEDKTQHTWSGVIEELTAERLVIGRVVMNEAGMPLMGPMRIEIDVTPADGDTLLRLSHSGYGYGEHWDTMYALVVQGWDHVLGDMNAWFREEY